LKRIPELVALLVVLSLFTQACQRATETAANSSAANTTATAQQNNNSGGPPAPPKTSLQVGQPAPDFTLNDTDGNPVKLSDFRGRKNVVLAFYVLAFTGG
jgi:cytochrome oxidase Cu insertion factor (SCO1/SenC/PrrC family)